MQVPLLVAVLPPFPLHVGIWKHCAKEKPNVDERVITMTEDSRLSLPLTVDKQPVPHCGERKLATVKTQTHLGTVRHTVQVGADLSQS